MKSSGSETSCGRAFPDVFLQPRRGPRADGHITVLAALSLIDQDQPTVELKIVQLQPHDFETPHSGRVQDLQQRAVAQPDGFCYLAQVHDLLDLLGRQDHLGQRAAETRKVDLGSRVVQDVILPGHPPEPHAQGHKPRVLRAEAQRLAVFLARVEQVPLIAFEHRPRHIDRIGDAAFLEPFEEKLDVPRAALHRELGVVPHLKRAQMLAHQRLQGRGGRCLWFALLLYAGHRAPPP